MNSTLRLGELFREGGWPTYVILLVGLAATTAAAAALVVAGMKARGARWVAGLGLLAAAGTVAAGIAGMEWGRAQVTAAVAHVHPVDRELILRQGFKESLACLVIGMAVAALPTLLALVAAALSAAREGQGLGGLVIGAASLAGAWALALHAYAQPLPGRDLTVAQRDVLRLDEELGRSDASHCGNLARLGEDDAAAVRALAEWRPVQERCVRLIADAVAAGGVDAPFLRDSLLRAPLLDPDLRTRLEDARPPEPPPAEPPPARPSGPFGSGGLGAIGSAPHEGHDAAQPSARSGAPTVVGRLDPEVIRRVIQRNQARVRFCYERGLARKPGLEGKVVVRMVISATGAVASAAAAPGGSFPDAEVEGCIVSAMRSLVFPRPEGGGVVVVTYPFVLRAG